MKSRRPVNSDVRLHLLHYVGVMRMNRLRKYLPITFMLIAYAASAHSMRAQQSSNSSKDWLINVPSAPLNLSLPPNLGSVKLESRSTGHIGEFQLGCIIQEKDKYSVADILEERHINLPGAYGEGDVNPTLIFIPLSEFEGYKGYCESIKAKVGIVGAVFSDGSTWRAKR